MTSFSAIVKLTCRSAVRSHVFQFLLFVLLLGVLLVPNTIKGDGTAYGYMQVSLEYCFTFITVMLMLSGVWLGCQTMTADVEDCRLHLIVVKPVSRYVVWLGKFTGVLAVLAALLLISSAVVYGFILYQSGRQDFPPEERARIKGLLINKFRGDVEILRPGLAMLEEKTQLPVLGVVPYLKVDIEDEDSLSTRLDAGRTVHPLDAAILRLPHISNFTDFMPLEQHPLLGVRYVQNTRQLGTPDLVILPGTKNTVDDLLWLRQSGLEPALLKLAARGTPVLGVCGGYQMLGQTLADPDGTESGRAQTLRGLGLLPTRTTFTARKRRAQVTAEATAAPFAGAALTGYEIHTGRTEVEGLPFCTQADGTPEGCVQDTVWGTYLHGLFDTGELTEKLVAALCARKGIAPDTAALMPFGNGAILPSTVKAVKKGSCGSAGELRGEFDLTEELGQLYANTGCGIFGTLNAACSLA